MHASEMARAQTEVLIRRAAPRTVPTAISTEFKLPVLKRPRLKLKIQKRNVNKHNLIFTRQD